MRKILYSPGYGAGWTTWESDKDMKAFMLEYQPLIDALEAGVKMVEPALLSGNKKKRGPHIHDSWDFSKCPKAVQQFAKDCMKKFKRLPYMGGLDDLAVYVAEGRVRLDEYDGFESVESEGSYSNWL